MMIVVVAMVVVSVEWHLESDNIQSRIVSGEEEWFEATVHVRPRVGRRDWSMTRTSTFVALNHLATLLR